MSLSLLCPHRVPLCPPGPCTPQHGPLGTEVLLPCPGGAAEWRQGDTVLGTSPAPGLALPNASLAHEGHYSCHHPVTGKTWATICLRLGCECPPSPAVTPPLPGGPWGCWQWGDPCPLSLVPSPDPPPPPAIECWASSYPQAVNCSWGLSPDPLLDTDFVATYRSVGLPKGSPHVTQPSAAVPVSPGTAQTQVSAP